MTNSHEILNAQKAWKDFDSYEYRSEIIGKANEATEIRRGPKAIRDLLIFLLVTVFVLAIASVSMAYAEDHADAAKSDAPKVFDAAQSVGTKATCPVMGDVFTISEKTKHQEYNGKHYYFCCPVCEEKFKADPEKYIK